MDILLVFFIIIPVSNAETHSSLENVSSINSEHARANGYSFSRPSSPASCWQWGCMDEFLPFLFSAAGDTSRPLWCRSSLASSIYLFLCVPWLLAPSRPANVVNAVADNWSYLSAWHVQINAACVFVSSVSMSLFGFIPFWCPHFYFSVFCLCLLIFPTGPSLLL